LPGQSRIALDYNQIAPIGAKALGGVYGYVLQCGLPPELVDLVYLRVSQINNCAYCLDMHMRDLVKKGVKIEKLALVQAWEEAGSRAQTSASRNGMAFSRLRRSCRYLAKSQFEAVGHRIEGTIGGPKCGAVF
jgi:AhpD family alkylhydroperoxidase